MTQVEFEQEKLKFAVEKLHRMTEKQPGGCWLWRGYTQPNGYGWINVRGLKIAAHRLALMAAGVPVPRGTDACHRCDVRACVNPDHLYPGTRRQNMADCSLRERHNKPRGEQHWCSKLSDADVRRMRERRAKGELLASLASEFGVNPATASRICRGVWR